MKKLFRFRYFYFTAFVFWGFMTAWLLMNVLKDNKGRSFYHSQFAPDEKQLLFQEKKYVMKFNDQIFGVVKSFFSLSDVIIFELDVDCKYRYRKTEITQKIFGKVTADRLRNIKEISFVIKSTDKANNFKLSSLQSRLGDNKFTYSFIEKDSEENKLAGEMPMKGQLWLINPIFPFGRNMKALKNKKSFSAFYNPMGRKFDKIEYTLTNKRYEIGTHKTIEVKAKIYNVEYSLYLTPAGELIQLTLPGGLSLLQVPSDLNVEIKDPISLEDSVNVFMKSVKEMGKKQ